MPNCQWQWHVDIQKSSGNPYCPDNTDLNPSMHGQYPVMGGYYLTQRTCHCRFPRWWLTHTISDTLLFWLLHCTSNHWCYNLHSFYSNYFKNLTSDIYILSLASPCGQSPRISACAIRNRKVNRAYDLHSRHKLHVHIWSYLFSPFTWRVFFLVCSLTYLLSDIHVIQVHRVAYYHF